MFGGISGMAAVEWLDLVPGVYRSVQESQLHDPRGLVAQRGFEIVQEYSDTISRVKARRPGLDQLMTDARRGRAARWSFILHGAAFERHCAFLGSDWKILPP
jgi:hypothetical protein